MIKLLVRALGLYDTLITDRPNFKLHEFYRNFFSLTVFALKRVKSASFNLIGYF